MRAVPSAVFSTPLHAFDAVVSAAAGLGNLPDRAALDEELIRRMETVDLARDAVEDSLSGEVRKNGPALMVGMQQIRELDLDVTRAFMQARTARRRLASVQTEMVEQNLRVATCAAQRDQCMATLQAVNFLEEALDRARSCLDPGVDVSERSARTLETVAWFRTTLDANPLASSLTAMVRTHAALVQTLSEVVVEIDGNLARLVSSTPLNTVEFARLLEALHGVIPDFDPKERLVAVTKGA